MSARKEDQIARVPLFSGLSAEEIAALAARAAEKRFAPGETIFAEGDRCEGVYLVLEGRVKIFKTSAGGREITLALEVAPASVAEVPLFDRGAYPASVMALDNVTAAFIAADDFRKVCREYPEVALKMLAAVGRRLRQLVGLIERVTFGSVRQRLAALLLELGRQAASESFPLPSTHQELASRLGTVREVVSRNISRFQSEGLIQLDGRQVRLLDRPGLQREAETEL